ncbi:ATP/GTP-binding protein [Ferruginibacter sp. HRS2-29]|uniref:AAA family ATPase n=1 Tax=Ferruginibacter sp. HRS2-29 TaxID=2487334 RepID=UPI0020CF8852|nr:ATP-binding protein [Ferruginibacter sp. HRS2-29]MCP9750876.1 ATP-binding protein [Ferruginibacter sp. HRS2-29]
MLIRFIVKNLFSFKELTEFNMLPGRFSRMPYHVYESNDIELLKLNAMYGANGAGKSNLIKSLSLLSQFVESGNLPIEFLIETFKFDKESRKKDVYIGVEFIKEEIPYYYGITINQGIVVEEELQISGIGKKEDYTLFRRTDKPGEKNLDLTFSKEVMEDKEATVFPFFLKNEILERNEPVLFHMASRKNKVFDPFKKALQWFTHDLVPVMPNARPSGLTIHLEEDAEFYKFASDVMQAFSTGIKSINVDTIPIEDFFGEDDKQQAERITAELKANPDKIRPFLTAHEEILFVLRQNKVVAKRLFFLHDTDGGIVKFTSAEESDGTRRLLDYLPAFYAAIKAKRVYIIDEIERSIHPLLIKELISKFSHDQTTHGQLIFSTHESNLLDQEIFRPDEIWFAEKNKAGATEVYALSEFKEHHTLDIRKGYLNGRYGGIPFLGNLKDLNWEKYAEA